LFTRARNRNDKDNITPKTSIITKVILTSTESTFVISASAGYDKVQAGRAYRSPQTVMEYGARYSYGVVIHRGKPKYAEAI
jgi:hypothetical protein